MSRISGAADRDGWMCWLCGNPVDPNTPPNTAWAPTVDHVVPKSRGGATEPANLRLAHRRCNSARGNRLPELQWPDEFLLIDAAPLWQTISRIMKRRHDEVVAVAPTKELATKAAQWASDTAERFVGGQWQTTVSSIGLSGDAHTVRMVLCGEPDLADPGRPIAP